MSVRPVTIVLSLALTLSAGGWLGFEPVNQTGASVGYHPHRNLFGVIKAFALAVQPPCENALPINRTGRYALNIAHTCAPVNKF